MAADEASQAALKSIESQAAEDAAVRAKAKADVQRAMRDHFKKLQAARQAAANKGKEAQAKADAMVRQAQEDEVTRVEKEHEAAKLEAKEAAAKRAAEEESKEGAAAKKAQEQVEVQTEHAKESEKKQEVRREVIATKVEQEAKLVARHSQRGAPGAPGFPNAEKNTWDVAEKFLEGNGAPEQGFDGRKVQHDNMASATTDWRQEFGPVGPKGLRQICAHPENRQSFWCKLHGDKIEGKPR